MTGGGPSQGDEATPTLTEADMAVVARLGTRRAVRVGEYLYRAGDDSYDFFVLETAEVEILVDADGTDDSLFATAPADSSAN